MSEKVIRVGVMGQGRSGYDIHVAWLRQATQQYKVVAVADQLKERHEAVQLGAQAFTDYKDLLAKRDLGIDLIVNSLPSHLHTPGTIAALQAGYNVLSEKPFALNLADFDAMVSAANKAGRKLFAFQNSRYRPGFKKMREVLASGVLGKLLHARISFSGFARRWDWQASQRYSGGNLNNTGPHPMDQAIVLFGERSPKVFAHLACQNEFGDADNLASVSLYGDGAPLVEVVVSSFMAYPQGDIYNISCSQGGMTGTPTSMKWRYYDPATAPAHTPMTGWSDNRKYCGEGLSWIEQSWSYTAGLAEFDAMSRDLYNNVYDVLVRGGTPDIKLEEVRRQIGVIEECHRQCPLAKRFS